MPSDSRNNPPPERSDASVLYSVPSQHGLSFVYLMGASAIVSGGLLFAAGFLLNFEHGRWLMCLGGIISAVWGVLLMLWPFVGAPVLTWRMAGYALFFGAALRVLAFRLRSRRYQLAPPGALPQSS